MDNIEQAIMNLIVNSGAAKSYAYNALSNVNEKNYSLAEENFKQANEYLLLAHNEQTTLLTLEANGESLNVNALFVHAQDHLMNAISEITLIEQIIELRKILNTLIEKQ
ncbi:PTS lactose/cellobiose transporter subunit IIA [Frischella sp. Ac48]|uniref:PTS lactose/cellobiose transporter subunit IIA n=1 Tax=Frischella japonica TaxID=2741544 RepID=A0ABR7QW93_9GAMM|nr:MULTISPECIES: PTS lactose/cellobiose transporter subunit IIA [Frischella]MBC9130492.1 PTS lactose/cellobiose transporter subunit IIA [Frischella japonica]MBX4133396.1 PTS lactose/cellobiose transporter subunit IIA [Frischella sp. Ac48]